jgi:hypothetical protein
MVVPELLQNFSCLGPGPFHQGVEYFEVRPAFCSGQVIDVGCQNLVDFDPSCRRFGFSDPCTVDMLVNVEGFARNIAVSRLAQSRHGPWMGWT